MTSIPPPTYYQVTMMGETYDIYTKRFEQDTDNLPGITSFWNNFKRAVATVSRPIKPISILVYTFISPLIIVL
jgi:hypothetical protein